MIQLTADQQHAHDKIIEFLDGPPGEFVLKGYSGTGKSTLVSDILASTRTTALPLIKDLSLTATTNKAAEVLASATGYSTTTIHKLLGLRVLKDHLSNKTRLVLKGNAEVLYNTILVVDEASMIDPELRLKIKQRTSGCHILYIGDPAQLLGVGATTSPVFDEGIPEVALTQVVRQAAGNPIIQFSSALKDAVNGLPMGTVPMDGKLLRRLPTAQAAIDEMTILNNIGAKTRVLAWRNKQVMMYNTAISQRVRGRSDWREGDIGISNTVVGDYIANGQELTLTEVANDIINDDIEGIQARFAGNSTYYFIPNNFAEVAPLQAKLRKDKDLETLRNIDKYWVDLRHSYALTVNKSQGSTYETVYLDLNDIGAHWDTNTLYRLLYVGASRASKNLILIGDIK